MPGLSRVVDTHASGQMQKFMTVSRPRDILGSAENSSAASHISLGLVLPLHRSRSLFERMIHDRIPSLQRPEQKDSDWASEQAGRLLVWGEF